MINVSSKTLKQQKGFTLIEVLTAFVVLSIGIFGALAMQGGALRFSQDAQYYTVSTQQLNQLYEGVREGNFNVRFNFPTIEGFKRISDQRMTSIETAVASSDHSRCLQAGDGSGEPQMYIDCIQNEFQRLTPNGRIDSVVVPNVQSALSGQLNDMVVEVSWLPRPSGSSDSDAPAERVIETWMIKP